jgi:hypothetical protein
VIHGYGVLTYGSGNIYEGNYANGKRNGKGKFKYTDGRILDGNWLDDTFQNNPQH